MRLVLALLLAATVPARAQLTSPGPARPGGCFRGAPAARCGWFPLLEAGVADRITRTEPGDDPILITWNLGMMVNQSANTAIGGMLFAAAEDEGGRVGLAARWRRWIGPRTSVDLALGLNVIGGTNNGNARVDPVSPMVQARFNLGDLVAGTARLDVLSLSRSCFDPSSCREHQWKPQLYIGAELGSWAGIPAYGGALLLAFVLFAQQNVIID